MTMTEARSRAIEESKQGVTRFVVYIPDQGQHVFTKEQTAIYGGLVMIEETYFNGYLIAT